MGKSFSRGKSEVEREEAFWEASRAYMSGLIGVEELKQAERTYAPELFKEAKKPALQNLVEGVAAKLKGTS